MAKSNGTTGKGADKTVTTPKSEKELTAIDKIRKLMEFSVENGATEAEVENAMQLAQRLMMKHNLEQKDIEINGDDINVTIVNSTWKDGMEARSYEWSVLQVLSKVYNCQTLRTRNKATNIDCFKVIGQPEDRELVVTIFGSVLPQIRTITKKRFKESDKALSLFKFTTSYQTGFLDGLETKLSADRETYFSQEDKESWGLMIVKKDALVEDWIQEFIKPKTVSTKAIELDPEVYNKGVEDGSEKSLNQQLGE